MNNLLNRINSYLVLCVSNRTLFLNRGFIAMLVAGVLVSSAAVAQLPDPGLDGYAAAQTNFRFISNATWTTDEAVEKMSGK